MNNTPCKSCPWRKSSAIGGADIPNFDITLMKRLSNTVGDGDALRPIMACHYSEIGKEQPCVGYVAVEGYTNISVRLMACRGEIDMLKIQQECRPIKMWKSFKAMLRAYIKAQKQSA